MLVRDVVRATAKSGSQAATERRGGARQGRGRPGRGARGRWAKRLWRGGGERWR
jgi:hypothetical protein